jgi:cyanophycin synthetase
MRILETALYRGPHLYSDRPMVRLQLDLGVLEAWPTARIPGFVDHLLAALPGLERHGCSYQAPGGLVLRLREGTWLGHVIEHVALELQTLAGASVTRGKTRSARGRPGVYNILYAYEGEALGRAAGRAAVELVNSLLPHDLQGVEGLERDRPGLNVLPPPIFDLPLVVSRLKSLAKTEALGPTTRSLVREAKRRGIPVQRLDEHSLVQLGWGARRKLIRASITGDTSHIAVETAGNKALTKAMLSAVGVPVPRGGVVRTVEEALVEAERIKGPVVLKPLDGNHGRGVSLGLVTPDQVRWGFDQAIKHGRRVIVEEQYVGRDYRILVVGGQVVAVAERVPAQVVGDGRSSVTQLIDAVNQDPRAALATSR